MASQNFSEDLSVTLQGSPNVSCTLVSSPFETSVVEDEEIAKMDNRTESTIVQTNTNNNKANDLGDSCSNEGKKGSKKPKSKSVKSARKTTTTPDSNYLRPKRQGKILALEKMRNSYSHMLAPGDENVEMVNESVEVGSKKSRPSVSSSKKAGPNKRQKKNDAINDITVESPLSTPSLKCSLPLGPNSKKAQKVSNYEDLQKHLPANVRAGIQKLLKSVDAQNLNIEGIEYDSFDIEIRLEEEGEQSDTGKEKAVDSTSDVEKDLSNEQGQNKNDKVKDLERQRSTSSASTAVETTSRSATDAPIDTEDIQNNRARSTSSMTGTEILNNDSIENVPQASSRIEPRTDEIMRIAIKEIVEDQFKQKGEAFWQKPEVQRYFENLMTEEFKKIISVHLATHVQSELQKWFNELEESLKNPSSR